MSSESGDTRKARVIARAEAFFGRPVRDVSAPGGEGRSSLRLHFDDTDLIATRRPDMGHTRREALVLRELGRHCDDVPRLLGFDGEILFQSDVGTRLNQEIGRHRQSGRLDIAAQAVSAIFRYQNAARRADMARHLSPLGTRKGWVRHLVDAVDLLQEFGRGIPDRFDRDAACAALTQPGRQFVKWDCRSGNAAIGSDLRLRWFDFEYSGLRHGAEDVAWLIGDESWPIPPDAMMDVVIDAYDPAIDRGLVDYLDYLSIYTTFHAIQRFRLILSETAARGWQSKSRIRELDDTGLHPDFAAHVLGVGRYFSAQSRITAPLSRCFEQAAKGFLEKSVARTVPGGP